MDILNNLLQLPVNSILVLAGIVLVFFTFFALSKGTVRMRKTPTGTGLIPAAIGVALILGGLLYRPQTASPAEPTPNPVALSQVSPVVPSETTAPTDTPTAVPSPTDTPLPPTETASPVPLKALADNCIATQTWKIDRLPMQKHQGSSQRSAIRQ